MLYISRQVIRFYNNSQYYHMSSTLYAGASYILILPHYQNKPSDQSLPNKRETKKIKLTTY